MSKKDNDPFGFNKAINWDKLEDPKVIKELQKLFEEEEEKYPEEFLEFKDNIQAHDSSSAINNEQMALELHIGQAIVKFYKPKYEKIQPQTNERNKWNTKTM